jgi:hypothetical protein
MFAVGHPDVISHTACNVSVDPVESANGRSRDIHDLTLDLTRRCETAAYAQ